MKKAAVISQCKKYRYSLSRTWDETLPTACFIMLNPSTADAEKDDPTIRRCVGFAKRLGCGGLVVVNLFAWRATDPARLAAVPDPIGPENDSHILRAATGCSLVVAAWGTNVPVLHCYRPADVKKLVMAVGASLTCLRKTKGGAPGHPLYVKADAPLVRF